MATKLAIVIIAVTLAVGWLLAAGPQTARADPGDLVYVSDSETEVAVSWDDVSYGPFRPAVPAWVHEAWPDIEGATWISSSYWAEGPWDESWRKFVRTFTVHTGSSVLLGSLSIGSDDSHKIYVNGSFVGSRDIGFVIDTYDDIPFVDGENTLMIIVKNALPNWAVSGPKDNPTGLIYKLDLGNAVELRMGVDGCGITTPPVGSNIYTPGMTVQISADPCPGSVFEGWTGDVAVPSSPTTTVTLDTDKSVTAHFSCTATLTMQVDGEGATTPPVGMHDYVCGTPVPISAEPEPGWSFAGWVGPVANPSSPLTTVAMGTHKTVTANFEPIPPNTLTMQTNGCGTTSPPTGSHDYAPGTVVNISADPCSNWTFVNWTGNVADRNSPTTTVTMSADKTVTANFAPPVTLTMGVEGCGTTGPPVGSSEHGLGDVVTVSALPSCPGWEFAGWTGSVVSPSSPTTTVTMDDDKTVVARFTEVTHVLTVQVEGCGSTTPLVGSYVYPWGAPVPVSALADENCVFDHWTGDVADPSQLATTVTMDSNKTITAHFLPPVELTVEVDGCGSTTPSVGTYLYRRGEVAHLCATACEGDYGFGHWTGDVADPDAPCTTITMDSDKTVTAHILPPLTLTMEVSGCGETSPPLGDHIYPANAVVDISATPCPGWQFDGWMGDVGNSSTLDTTVTMNSDKTVTANLSPIPAPFGLQLAVALDGSASILNSEWVTQIDGLSNALLSGTVPRDGSVELTVIQYAHETATTEVPPTVIGADNWDDVAAAVQGIVKRSGITPIALGIRKAVEEITGSSNFGTLSRRVINISGDIGELTLLLGKDEAEAERNAAIAAGVDEINAEGIGDIRDVDIDWLQNEIVWPQPGTIAPPFDPGWVYRVGNAAEFEAAIAEKVRVPDPTYSLVVTSSEGGSVTEPELGEGIYTYTSGTVVDLVATRDPGWVFTGWTGAVASPLSPTTTITMDDYHVISAQFTEGRVLEVGSGQGGMVTQPGEGPFTYLPGTEVALVASPYLGWAFTAWTGDVDDPFSPTTTITMNEYETVAASFHEVGICRLAVGSTSGGSVIQPGEAVFEYSRGAIVNLMAAADQGYAFDGWIGNVADPWASATTITMDQDGMATARFVKTYTLTISSGTGGSVTNPSEGVFVHKADTVVPLTATDDYGWAFDAWTGSVADPSSATTTIAMTQNRVVSASFVKAYLLALSSSGGGAITTPGEGLYEHKIGTVVDLAAKADFGRTFLGWAGNVADPSSLTTSITMYKNEAVVASFSGFTMHTLTVQVSGNGAASPEPGPYEYPAGTVVNLLATPDDGNAFTAWSGAVADPASAVTTVTMDSDKTVTASFLRTFTLTIQASGGGSTTPQVGDHVYTVGTIVNIAAFPDPVRAFRNWTGDVADPDAAFTTVTIESDKTITANFAPISNGKTLTIIVSGAGVTTPPPGAHLYEPGAVVSISATSDAEWKFTSWSSNVASPTSPTTTVTMSQDTEIVAYFYSTLAGGGKPPPPTTVPTPLSTRIPRPTRPPTPAPVGTPTPITSPTIAPPHTPGPTSTTPTGMPPPTPGPSPGPDEEEVQVPWSLVAATVLAVVGVGVLFYVVGRKGPK